MNNKNYEYVMPFVWECVLLLTMYFFIIMFVIWTKFQSMLINIYSFAAGLYYLDFFNMLLNIIRDLKENNIVTEYMYVSLINKNRFDFLFTKKYLDIQCHKVKGKRYTGEIIYLKSSKEINLKEKSFLEISYYKNSKIIYNINLEKK